MHLFFLDESGTVVPQKRNHTTYFVIGGIIIPEIHWHEIFKKLRDLKRQYNIISEIKWRYFSPNNKDDGNGLQHLSFEQKNEVRNKLYEIITSYKSIKIISTVTNIESAYNLPNINNQDDLYWYSYKQAVERFQYYLQDLSRESGADFNGLVIIDNRLSCDDNRLRSLHHNLLITNHEGATKFNNLIEGLFIAPSHLSVGIQFADLVAGAIFRKYEKDDNRYFDKIKGSIRNKDGNISGYGIVKFPKQA
ncbi:MAG: DUF3800 domain-containing protein [Candidatus Gastranaerophilales bacterium]|nr:DUF3800 domain-containing protein [Candidatus Gastranaerophilales bacterium]